jgi:hypothetical protein
LYKALLLILFLVSFIAVMAQQKKETYVTVSGTVYDISAKQPIEAVAVLSTSGNGTLTDSLGKYSFTVKTSDSIWFSMLGKTTVKFPVDTIANLEQFNIMIHLKVTELPEVRVRNKNYKLDSLQNRIDYAKVFNFKKPSLVLSDNRNYNPGSVSVGFDLQEIINIFRFKRNRSLAALQKRLLQQERDKYIDSRFTKSFVRKLTKLESPALEKFMITYRPDYDIVTTLNDIEFGYLIQKAFESYKINEKDNQK